VKPFAKWLLLSSSVATGLTGLVYLWMDRVLEPLNEFAAINHPLQPLVLKAHIVVAPLLVFALGVIGVDHIWKYFRGTMKRARRSGVSATWVLVPMVLSGYLIQAVTALFWLEGLAWLHIVTGVFYLGAIAVHQLVVRRLRLVSLHTRVRPDLADEGERRVDRPSARPPTPPLADPSGDGQDVRAPVRAVPRRGGKRWAPRGS
jgi:hypothetical protein